ncbi:MAG: type II secretion system protein [Candidatus Paceibacteria bacterium]
MKHFGFTLIECLIYLAIFGVFMSGLIVVLGNLNYRLVERERDFIALRDQQFIFDKIEWLLNTANTVSVVDSSTLELDYGSETLRLVLTDGQLFILSLHRGPELISPAYMAIEDFTATEETVDSDKQVGVSYIIDNKTISHHVYVPL